MSDDTFGPQIARYTCTGCSSLIVELWREPSGDGETFDGGTHNKCASANQRLIDGSYGAYKPSPPDWCPATLQASQ